MQIPPHQEPQPASIPPAQANNEAVSPGSATLSTTPSQQVPAFNTNVDQDRFAVKARGISLYALWDSRHEVAEPPIEISDGIGIRKKTYGLWKVRHFIWQPGSNKTDKPAMTAAEVERIIIALLDRLKELYAANPPLYLIFHIEKLITPESPFSRFFRNKKKTSEEFVIDNKEGFLEQHIQPFCDLGAGYVDNGWLPNRFRHYDQSSHKKGWLVISPTRALFADVDVEQVITLASLLQPYYTDSNRGPGILSERYYDMLVLIMQWVNNQDSLQAVDQLKGLVVSGTQAIDGQVWLNFAVAGIGILIAFLLTNQNNSDQLIASMVCLAIASLMFWGYARFGQRVFLFIGWLVALAIVPCLFAWTQVISIYDAVIKFLPHL